MFDITDDFSLIIKNATLGDEMLYTCYATGYGLDVQYYNSTQVYVYAKGIRKGTSSIEAPVETASTHIPLKTGHPDMMYGHSTETAVSTDTLSTQSTKHSGCKRDIYGVSAVLFGFFVVAMVLSLCVSYWLWRRRR
ncbi:uncharacterized protein [Diadema antillarum]|uniref:uncharacterized protein n=1 Tax=Diadema antillarum TaxID=105358 RepID=UPI003A84F93E